MIASNRDLPRRLAATVLVVGALAGPLRGEEPALRVRLTAPTQVPMLVEVLRWSTDVERAALVKALAAPPAPPAPPAGAAPAGRAGRGGRGGRGAAPPASAAERVTTAVKASPTVGYLWGDGPTGYSIKYAWKSALADGRERVVLVTDRRVAASPESVSSAAAADAEFTVLEMRHDRAGSGEAKLSHAIPVIGDAAAAGVQLDGYDAAPGPLKVTR